MNSNTIKVSPFSQTEAPQAPKPSIELAESYQVVSEPEEDSQLGQTKVSGAPGASTVKAIEDSINDRDLNASLFNKSKTQGAQS